MSKAHSLDDQDALHGQDALHAQNAELRLRLQEADETLQAIRRGDVDALVVENEIYTLESAGDASNRLRKDVLAQMDDAVLAFDLDERVTFMNAAAERQYGISASAFLGRLKSDVYREEALAADDANSFSSTRSSPTQATRTSSTHHCRSGAVIHVETTLSPMRDAGGAPIGSLAVIRDVSGRIRADQIIRSANEELARRERQFATLVENAPDVFARMDRAFRHLYVSPVIESYSGIPAAAHVGKTNAELGMPPELCARWEAAIAEVFETGRRRGIKFEFATPSGSTRIFEARLIPEVSADGSVESVLSIASDITERESDVTARKLAEESLRNTDRRKDEFLATLAHELRNPLAPIRNALQIMRLTNDAEAVENARGIIERQLGQLVHLVDDLLDVNRISQGKVELRKVDVDVAAIVRAAIETSRPLIDAAKHTLTVQLPGAQSAIVNADPTRLGQVVANLLNNAAKYTPEGGHIDVCARFEAGEAVIAVSDDGVGISAEMLPRVFEMFAQVDHTVSRSQGGLGIGLTLVKRLVEMHGGTVRAESDGPGRGCVFTVRVPLVGSRSTTAIVGGEASSPRGPRKRILVVDDSHDIASSTAELLTMLGHETFIAHDGEEAVALVGSLLPAIVLLDIGLPKRSGHDVARWIRAQPGGADILLIALSGWGQKDDVRKSREAGFDMHLVKPVELDTLVDIISRRR